MISERQWAEWATVLLDESCTVIEVLASRLDLEDELRERIRTISVGISSLVEALDGS